MSVYFSVDELFQAIENNDIVALKNAIFFLGANIHMVRICENLTPMSYAARLGHFEQVKILLADMKRYEDEDSEFVLKKIGEIIYLAIPNRHKGIDFLLELFDILAARNKHLDMRRIFKERIYDFLEAILEKDTDRYIQKIVEGFTNIFSSLDVYTGGLFQLSDKARSHPILASELDKVRGKDPLYYAVVVNDAEEMKRLLPNDFRNQFLRCRIFTSVFWKREPHFPLRIKGFWELMKLVIEKDDVSLFNVLMNINMAEILRVTEPTQERLICNIFIDSLHRSSINIINHVLSLGKPSKKHIRETDWWHHYFALKLQGKVKSAEAVKAFRELGITDKADVMSFICTFIKKWVSATEVSKDILIETFDEIEDFIRETPDHAEMLDQFLSAVRDMPKTSGRTDLVEPLTKYGVQYSRTEVIVQMNKDINFDRFNEPRNKFLAWDRRQVSVSSIKSSLSAYELIMECARQLGGSIDASIEPLWSSEDRKSYERAKREHVASVPSLQKQCRLTIREAMYTSNPVRPTDAVLSLFVNNYLPKTLVNYMLFRDEDVQRPLHYLLVNLEDSDYSDYSDDSDDSDDSHAFHHPNYFDDLDEEESEEEDESEEGEEEEESREGQEEEEEEESREGEEEEEEEKEEEEEEEPND